MQSAMAKRLLVIVGSPRVGGNTDLLADALIEGAVSAGHTAKKIHLGQTPVHGCVHCGHCYANGECSQKDGMQQIYDAYHETDVLVFASPVYFYHLTSQMKAMLDRMYALSYAPRTGTRPQECMLLMCAEDSGERPFRWALQYYRDILSGYLRLKDAGTLLVGGVFEKGGIASQKPQMLERAREMGRKL